MLKNKSRILPTLVIKMDRLGTVFNEDFTNVFSWVSVENMAIWHRTPIYTNIHLVIRIMHLYL